jgi:iron complex outermembrane recepter protein
VSWSRGGLQIGLTGRYLSSYRDVNLSSVRIDRRIPDQTYLDVQCSYSFDATAGQGGVLDGVTLRAGAVNVLDAEPEYSDVNIVGYDPSQADVRGRFVYFGLSKRF